MSTSKRSKHRNKAIVAGLATAAALAGGAGVAAAGSPTTAADNQGASSQAEGPEQAEGSEQKDSGEQEPSLNGSVPAKEVAGETEQQEQTRLAADAKVSQADARAAALAAVPGTVTVSELGNENGSLIWEVGVKKADGSVVEVKVDAGDAKVLAQEADDEGGESSSKSPSGEAAETSTG